MTRLDRRQFLTATALETGALPAAASKRVVGQLRQLLASIVKAPARVE